MLYCCPFDDKLLPMGLVLSGSWQCKWGRLEAGMISRNQAAKNNVNLPRVTTSTQHLTWSALQVIRVNIHNQISVQPQYAIHRVEIRNCCDSMFLQVDGQIFTLQIDCGTMMKT